MKVGLLACWYKDVSMANYSYSLKGALEKYAFVSVKVISSPCYCAPKYRRESDALQDRCDTYITFPPLVLTRPRRKIGWIAYTVVQFALQLTRGMRYLWQCRTCQVIHYQQSAYSFGILPLIPIVLVPTSNKKVVTVHTLDKTLSPSILKIIYNRANGLIVHSEEMKKSLVSIGVDDRKVKIIPHGTNIPRLLHKERNVITFLGAPTKDKGAFVLLDALRLLKQRRQKTLVHFYGIYSSEEKLQLEGRAKRLGVEDCIMLGGRLSESEFDEKLQESMFTFAVYTAPVSGSSIVTRAMANATPVIATNLGGVPEYLKGSGVLISPNDPEALANAISELTGDSSLREKLSNFARNNTANISWNSVAQSNLTEYLEVLGH